MWVNTTICDGSGIDQAYIPSSANREFEQLSYSESDSITRLPTVAVDRLLATPTCSPSLSEDVMVALLLPSAAAPSLAEFRVLTLCLTAVFEVS